MNRFAVRPLALLISLTTASSLAVAADVIELDESKITAETAGVAGQATTEGTRSYTTGSMSTSAGLPLSIRETPQSVSVITRQRIEDQGLNNLDDVVKAAPGVTLRRTGSDRREYLARGFRIDNLMYDGLPTTAGTFTLDTLSATDLAIYDRIEVVRGATGLMTGAGDPSATLNLVRKRPTATPQASVTTSAGSWDRYRTEIDVSNKLNDSGTLRGRAVAAYEDNDSFIDVRGTKRQTFYGILEGDLSDATTFTIGASKQREDKKSAACRQDRTAKTWACRARPSSVAIGAIGTRTLTRCSVTSPIPSAMAGKARSLHRKSGVSPIRSPTTSAPPDPITGTPLSRTWARLQATMSPTTTCSTSMPRWAATSSSVAATTSSWSA